jgi:hypothetical protein
MDGFSATQHGMLVAVKSDGIGHNGWLGPILLVASIVRRIAACVASALS